MKRRVYILMGVLAGGMLVTHVRPEQSWYRQPVSFVNEWVVQPVIGFFKRLFTIVTRESKKSLVAVAALLRVGRQQEAEPAVALAESGVIATNFTPDFGVRSKNKLEFFTITDDKATQLKTSFTNVLHMFVSPNKKLLFVVFWDHSELLEITQENTLVRKATMVRVFDRGAWSGDSTLLALRQASGHLDIYNVAQGFEASVLPAENVVQMAWTPRKHFFAIVTQAGTVRIFWQQDKWPEVNNDLTNVASISWSPRRDYLLVTDTSGILSLYKLPSSLIGKLEPIVLFNTRTPQDMQLPPGAELRWSPTTEFLALLGDNNKLSLFKVGFSHENKLSVTPWDIGPHQTLAHIKRAYWIDDNQIAVISDNVLHIYLNQHGLFQLDQVVAEDVQGIKISPDGAYILLRLLDGGFSLYNFETVKLFSLQLTTINQFYWLKVRAQEYFGFV